MASKKTKPAAGDDVDVDELFSGLDRDTKPPKKTTKSKPTSAASKAIADQDILADLESQLAEQPSRPHTPRLKDAARRSTATPPAGDPRKSTDSARSLKATFTPSATSSDLHENEKKPISEPVQQQDPAPQASGGGWWGGILSTASAAMKQAEAAVTQIQQNEEAKKWADQVKGIRGLDVTTLRTYGDELRHRALPTFTNILHTLAPPISSHERLLIHISHDLVGYPSLDPLIHNVFGHVMAQVEGGDLLVIQRGQESHSRRSTDSAAGWHDGPWWRQTDTARELGLINGLPEGTKLCRANAESHANEYFSANGGVETAKLKATEDVSETNPVRTSDLFLAVQAIAVDSDGTLFARTASAEKEKQSSDVQDQDDEDEELICFAVFILDPVHDIEFYTVSQSIPARWVQWLDTPAPLTPHSGEDGDTSDANIPEEIRDIIDSGGVDPREWVAEWLEELLNLSIGTVAQRYVARRMGVGEGGLGRGKKRMEDLVQDNAGEAARAGVI